MAWDPAQYLKFANERLQPALDLLARVALERPRLVVDLGCGAGNVTRFLSGRWPEAEVIGVDASPDMLAKAAEAAPGARFERADIGAWRSVRAPDLIFSNAALHWLDDHATLFPRLVAGLAPGGVLAAQMPRNHGAASHRAMVEAAEAGPWRERLRPVLRENPVAPPSVYRNLLAARVRELAVWETEYLHVLSGDDPVVAWTKGTALRPLLDALEPADRAAFEADYAARLRKAYPKETDGKTLFPFRRLFLLAQM
ncbi:MAG: methyltransferase domain-containing protein [Alphaproteobacteria bacterium]|nr:methyltransferase domain-containing protein [Alphaproteobacteria bacterium]